MSLIIRPRHSEDLPRLAHVLVRVHAHDGYPVEGVDHPEAWLIPPRQIAAWTALYEGQPVGQVSLTRAAESDDAAIIWHRSTGRPISELALLVRLFIDPEHRRHGAGQQLAVTAYSFARERDLAIAFDVMLKDHAAIRLYERLGCRRIGVITHRHGEGQSEPAAVYEAPL